MLTDPPTARSTDGPLDRVFPVGHHPPRRVLPTDLASALWEARVKSQLPNWALARLTGIDASYLSKLMRGTRCPSLVVAERLVECLPLSEGEKEALFDCAVPGAGKSRVYPT